MAKITVRTAQQATDSALPAGFSGSGNAAAYFDDGEQPLRLYVLGLEVGQALTIGDSAVDKLVYVWRGTVAAGGCILAAGSSIIIEHCSSLALVAGERTTLLAFSAAQAPARGLAGGHVHLLPAELAPRTDSLGGSVGLGGSDARRRRLRFLPNLAAREPLPADDRARGCGSRHPFAFGRRDHFVLGGEICLGARFYGPGTAIAIAADTLYSFTAGPTGLHFANFRAARPGDIRFAKGHSISETGYWRERLPRPEYLSPSQ